MTTTAREIDKAPLTRFLQATRNRDPREQELESYIRAAGPSQKDQQTLRRWQHLQESGDIETEVCTNCWAISIRQPDDDTEPLLFNACSGCQREICDQCHNHVPGPQREACLCRECALETPSVPEWIEPVKAIVRQYMLDCQRKGRNYRDGRVLNGFLRRHPQPVEDGFQIRKWHLLCRKNKLHSMVCTNCEIVAVSERGSDLHHDKWQCPAPGTRPDIEARAGNA